MKSATDEGRPAPRRRVVKAGSIKYAHRPAISCTVRNLSAKGASLEVECPFGISAMFALVVNADALKRTCRIVSINNRRIGVRFIEA